MRGPRILTLAIAVAIGALIAGCGRALNAPDTAPSAPLASIHGGENTGGSPIQRQPPRPMPLQVAPAPVPLSESGVSPMPTAEAEWYDLASERVSAGETEIVKGGRWELRFKPGSLTEDTDVTVRCWDDDVLDCELGPHGIQFPTPVEVRISYEDTRADPSAFAFDGTKPAVYWYDDDNKKWVEVPGFDDRANRQYVVHLSHFSRYILGGKAGW